MLASHQGDDAHYHYHDDHDPHHPRHRRSFSGSESSWTDTGDIGERKGDDDDPVRLQLSNDIEEELLAGVQQRSRKSHKKVRIQGPSPGRHGRSQSPHPVIDKEAIEVPRILPWTPSRAQRCIGFIMSGRSGAAKGLTGKTLLYVPRLHRTEFLVEFLAVLTSPQVFHQYLCITRCLPFRL